ncbi:MAG TPA: FadR/GntR family transcriptional regulator [Gaiellaceae bacterium]|nr:FadR/GntR family transcriptional regulator [Gaiellaceae bacterium]
MDHETLSPGRRRGAGVTDEAIDSIRELIASGQWGPGTRLPREADLAKQLGLSRNSLREAVRALSLARVLEVRQGDGTYVSSLEPGELLEPTLSATHLLRGRTVLELFEVRRMLEPEAAAMAAQRADAEVIGALRRELDRMVAAGDRAEELVKADAAFHDVIARAPGNGVLQALLRSLSTSTVRARLWHGLADRGALDLARDEHARIYDAIAAGDADVARAATLLHIVTNETWLREHLGPADDVPLDGG